MSTNFEASTTHSYDGARQHEWIETNGLGGWASSTIIGAHTRRYHGLLVVATRPPVDRVVLLSKLDETIVVGQNRHELGCNQYPNTIHPTGYQYVESFSRDIFPVFEYKIEDIRIRKTIVAVHGENTTLVFYEVLEMPEPCAMELQPLVAARPYHTLLNAEEMTAIASARFEKGVFYTKPLEEMPPLYISNPSVSYTPRPVWYYNFEYEVERYRGLNHHEDLFSHGVFHLPLKAGDTFGIIISTNSPEGRDPLAIMETERQRRQALVAHIKDEDDPRRTLTLAADQFIVKRGDALQTIIAGYHWFSDWGRDAMIALPGLCLATRRFGDAKKILMTFANHVSQGMLPNRFPDEGDKPEYNTVDATLWFFIAVSEYLAHTQDKPFIRDEIFPVLKDIISWHEIGTRHGIRIDEDGLLMAGTPDSQLTWMDAKVGEKAITPRHGKAVEINALWFNALIIIADLATQFGDMYDSRLYTKAANQAKASFQKVFWNETTGALYDVVNEQADPTLRPNQIFALSLPVPLLKRTQAQKVLKTVEDHLLTPRGLRSLSPTDSAYTPKYGGSPQDRDMAYHQGTVWGWLIGPYLSALLNVRPKTGPKQALSILNGFLKNLGEAGTGTLSEIFDGDLPHAPRGCIAQAWSVAEVLRVMDALKDGEVINR